MDRTSVILIALCLLAPVLARADVDTSRVVRYDTLLQLQVDGSVISTRTLSVSFPRPETLYHFYFFNTSSSGTYTYTYRYELLSAEADYGSGFEPVLVRVQDRSEWWCTLGGARQFPSLTRFRLKVREWGDTFKHEGGIGLRAVAVPTRPVDGTEAGVVVEVPTTAATGARYDFVVGPRNSMDGVMVGGATPRAVAPGEFQAALEGPDHAVFTMLRPMSNGDSISVGVYMASTEVKTTMSWAGTNASGLPSLFGRPIAIGLAFAVCIAVGLCAAAVVLLLILVVRRAALKRM